LSSRAHVAAEIEHALSVRLIAQISYRILCFTKRFADTIWFGLLLMVSSRLNQISDINGTIANGLRYLLSIWRASAGII
jgi:hypothetical protein